MAVGPDALTPLIDDVIGVVKDRTKKSTQNGYEKHRKELVEFITLLHVRGVSSDLVGDSSHADARFRHSASEHSFKNEIVLGSFVPLNHFLCIIIHTRCLVDFTMHQTKTASPAQGLDMPPL